MGWKVLDCAATNGNCAVKSEIVEANPDIAGIGVLVSFLAAACLAFLIAFSVIFLDRYESIINLVRRWILRKKDPYVHDYNGPYWRSPSFWSRVLSKNLLAFSDTQLLTGLAIQFTAMLKHCEISVYHWRVVVELAFLTTVTHLLTVIALRNYFVKNKWINLPRIFFMLGNLALLGYTSFVAYSYDLVPGVDLSQSLSCFFQGDRPTIERAFGGKWALLLIGAIGGHVTVILAMYCLKDPKDTSERRQWWWWLGAAFRTWLVAPIYSIYGIWMAGTGLSETQALGTPPYPLKIDGSETKWNFGQFLPVLLLALPLFAGWESFWEEYDEDRDNRFGRGSMRVSRGGPMSQFDMTNCKPPELDKSERAGPSTDLSVEEERIESDGSTPVLTSGQTPAIDNDVRSRPASLTLPEQPSTTSPPDEKGRRRFKAYSMHA
ncbi:hypothetical protein ACN47E_003078 [Coniothyrium glycines]